MPHAPARIAKHAAGPTPANVRTPPLRTRSMPAYGNQAMLRTLPGAVPQTKLTIGQAGDAYEREADRVADQVMRMTDTDAVSRTTQQVSRKCAACEQEDQPLQTKSAGDSDLAGTSAPPVVVDALREPGQPLDATTRAFFEPRFAHDFGSVRIHSGPAAARAARAIHARAYTVGNDIVFNDGEFRPDATDSQRLLAHELTHVIQQGAGRRGGVGSAHDGGREGASPAGAAGHAVMRKNMFECRELGVPCPPATMCKSGAVGRLIDCIPAATANLPGAISPGVCVFQCEDGTVCACVMVGTKESALCTFKVCTSLANAAGPSQDDIDSLVAQVVAQAKAGSGDKNAGKSDDNPGGGASDGAPPVQAKFEDGFSGASIDHGAPVPDVTAFLARHVAGIVMDPASVRLRSAPILQRADAPSAPDDGSAAAPKGAPPTFVDDFDVPADGGTGQNVVQASPANDSVPAIQRQAAPGAGATPAPAGVQTLTWGDYPIVSARVGGFSANTGISRSWKSNGTGFSVAFDKATSWSVQADQTAGLLRHEQYHLNLAALMATKANAAAGTMTATKLISEFSRAIDVHTASYDGDTQNGTEPRLQGLWEADIDKSVPEFPIT